MNAHNAQNNGAYIEHAKTKCPWFVPVVYAVRQGISFSVATPDISITGAPGSPGKGEVLYVGDDNIETVGPSGFPPLPKALVEKQIKTADQIIFVACEPLARFYEEAANAALGGKNVVLIEARRETQIEWVKFIRAHARPCAVVTCGLVEPLEKTAL